MNKVNETEPRKICVPRMSLEAKIIHEVSEQDGTKSRKPLKYENALKKYGHVLTEEQKTESLSNLKRFMSDYEAKLKLGF